MEQQYLTNTENTLNRVVGGNNVSIQLSPLKTGMNSLAGRAFRLYVWWETTLQVKWQPVQPLGDPGEFKHVTETNQK